MLVLFLSTEINISVAIMTNVQEGMTVVGPEDLVVIPGVEVFLAGMRRVRIRVWDPNLVEVDDPIGWSPIIVYPNPANGVLHLDASESALQEGSVVLYDLLGRAVKTVDFSQRITLDLEGLSRGLYVLTVEGDQGMVFNDFVIVE